MIRLVFRKTLINQIKPLNYLFVENSSNQIIENSNTLIYKRNYKLFSTINSALNIN